MAIRTRICDLLEIEHPILLAGMGGASTPELAAAVSNAGGLGVLGAAACGPRQLREWIQRTRALTDKPFGVDTLLPASVRRQAQLDSSSDGPKPADLLPELKAFAAEFMAEAGLEKIERAESQAVQEPDGPPIFTTEFFDAQMEVIIEERVPLYVSGLGNPGPWMERLKANGTKVGAVVGKVKHAVQVMQSGIDFIVAQGHDGGGHNSPIGTIALVPQVVDAV
ncbi:MAG: nitronate monooxygenase, partial [Pseudomonadales bacterium]|nr:nitronate monooxygenase [Pseudomonadales bacterium]